MAENATSFSQDPVPVSEVDFLLTAQVGVAWAGEGGEEPRLGWWRSDLASEFGGEDLFRRLLPSTWRWATLQGARAAAMRRDHEIRAHDHDPDRLLTLFNLGFEIDERVEERLQHLFFRRGIAINTAGAVFGARIHRYPGIFGDKGRSLFPLNPDSVLCALNSSRSRSDMQSLNPTIDFTVGDVNRLPIFQIENSSSILTTLEVAFEHHEKAREASVDFRCPGGSPWKYAERWGQIAVDRSEGAPLPPYEPEYDLEPPTDHLSFAFGVALSRFDPKGEGILDPAKDDLSHAFPDGILFLDGSLDANDHRDGLGQPAARMLHNAWSQHGATIALGGDLRAWLRLKFFGDVHKGMYENRPIHWPLSSEKKTFVAWINIHRWNERTLRGPPT